MLADIVKEHQCEGSKSARDGIYLVNSKLLCNVWILKHIEYNKIHMAWVDECVHIIKFCPYCGEKLN